MPTPIRTRGRRKVRAQSDNGVPKPVSSGPRGGRPMLPPDVKRESGSYKRARLLAAKPPPPRLRRRLSRLESLPVELIEKIFLYSLNVNLPRCSSSISAAVSSDRIYRALTLLAFFDPEKTVLPDLYPPNQDVGSPTDPKAAAIRVSETQISRILRPLEYIHLEKEERSSLQASVVRCRWCTIDRLISSLPDLMCLAIWRYWFPGAHISLNIRNVGPDVESATDLTILDVSEIPDKFLSGANEGFNEAHTRFLEVLRLAGGLNRLLSVERINEINFSREAIQQGIHAALVEHNANALTTLLKLDEFTFRCQNNLVDAVYTLPPEHFRTAVRVARHDSSFFQLLLRASAESVPYDDSEITHWAVTTGGPFEQWLLDFMLQLPEQIRATTKGSQQMFYHGGLNTASAMTERYLRDILGTDELKVWLEESSYDFPSEWIVES
ncbi:predicted protein [Aspergillus nidulans FGSC A4]|uniref:F-box domain-containing protein n=1 Tax=Emericella nidulans (strain FGSC A4 / ATCC 38163 / CBS 112.46 / NRRL 194 / M139) TaxID=227321 RepID=Q5AYJ6_EMENI|nr:hypothetical protein [Aspergillus nidulans FGSC A4]EAA58163.1 predicted protein [Aspergillus nidulans FGSC A4]CBF71140.1 TPA: conserved hypothetical protein [Aspergillus nidulans FGSC A4]|eukprot:XP_664238.1 predicted protein [Aspergillus nidulans FGSC A4]